jgi:hypothetical protein
MSICSNKLRNKKQEREDNANDAAVETTSLGSKELERAPPLQCKSQRCKQVPSVASKCPKQAKEPVALHITSKGSKHLTQRVRLPMINVESAYAYKKKKKKNKKLE